MSISVLNSRFSWKGAWKGGELVIDTDSLDELRDLLAKLSHEATIEEVAGVALDLSPDRFIPKLSGNLGCTEAVKQALTSNWGKSEPRTMAELQKVFERNALFFSRGTLSGVLTYMTRSGQVRRLNKLGKWAYVPSNL